MPKPIQQGTTPTARPRRRRRAAILLGTLLIVVAAVLFTGRPQAWLVRWVAERVLHARVEVSGVSLIHAIHADEVRLYDEGETSPTVVLHGVDVTRDVFSTEDRMVPNVSIERIEARVVAQGPGRSNIDFLRLRMEQPEDAAASLRFVPRHVTVDRIDMDAQLESMGLTLNGLEFEATVSAPGRFAVGVLGSDLSGARWFGDPSAVQSIDEGAVDLFIQQDSDGALVLFDADVPVLATVAANGTMKREAGRASWEVAIDTAHVEGLALEGLEGIVPVPLQFASFDATDTHAQVVQADRLRIPQAALHINAAALAIGPEGDRLFQGDVAIDGTASVSNTIEGDVVVTLGHGQAATLVASGTPSAGQADIAIANWSFDDLADVTPEAYRDQIAALPPFEGLSGNVTATWDGDDYTVAVQGTSSTADVADTVALNVRGGGSRNGQGMRFDGQASVKLAQGLVDTTLTLSSGGSLDASATLTALELRRWLALAMGEVTPSLPDAKIDGSMTVSSEDVAARLGIVSDLSLTGLELGGLALTENSPLTIQGAIDWDRASATLSSNEIDATLPDRVELRLAGWQHDLRGSSGHVDSTAHVSLDWLALGELWGELDGQAPISYTRNNATATVAFTTDTFGWGDWAIPYGKEVTGSIGTTYSFADGGITLSDGAAALDDGNVLHVAKGTVRVVPFQAELGVAIDTDLQPIVALGLLEQADGSGSFAGNLGSAGGSVELSGTLEVNAATATLPANRAALSGLRLTSDVAYTSGLRGSGHVDIDSTVVSGARVTGVSSPVTWENAAVRLDPLTGQAYRGEVEGSLRLGLLEPGRPLTAKMTFSNLNLSEFSGELAPEDFAMTGIAHGAASATVHESQLGSLHVDAECTDGFTLSREMVQQILQSPRFTEMLGKKQLDKAMDKILGTAGQRPFNRAAVTLDLDNLESLKGQATLESEKTDAYRGLDLTIDLDLPVAGLSELMALASGNE